VLEEQLIAVEALVIVSLLVASIVAIAVRRIRLPYTVALVLVGLFVTVEGDQLILQLTPGSLWILYGSIPKFVQSLLDFDPEFMLFIWSSISYGAI
jgi:hypothetical protein